MVFFFASDLPGPQALNLQALRVFSRFAKFQPEFHLSIFWTLWQSRNTEL